MAIIGIGVDQCNILRMEKSLQKEHFVSRVFGLQEREYLQEKKTASYAANFAAKEAFGKALGCGIMTEFSLHEVQVLRDKKGKPYFLFSGKAKELVKQKQLQAHVSLTHESDVATAFVILELK